MLMRDFYKISPLKTTLIRYFLPIYTYRRKVNKRYNTEEHENSHGSYYSNRNQYEYHQSRNNPYYANNRYR